MGFARVRAAFLAAAGLIHYGALADVVLDWNAVMVTTVDPFLR